jgi:3-phenylpropionate/cinnamic acid dioxygenase small subunit
MTAGTNEPVGVLDAPGRRVSFADPAYAEIMDFLHEEAALLDRDRYLAWTELLTDDVAYTIPGRHTLHMKDGPGIDENSGIPGGYAGLVGLAERNEREGIYDRDPPPRMRRFVTNVKAYHTDKADEYAVESYLLFLRTLQDEPTYSFVSAERKDVLRRTDDGLKLARRRLLFDLAVLSTPLPNVIL